MSKTISAPHLLNRKLSAYICAALLLVAAAISARAQSTDFDRPTPVTASEVAGKIVARDIGDSRLTRYFYVLTGTPGDLVLTVESRNLDGDIDLFQAGTLRPLAKVSMYAGELSTSTSKSIYLRQRETLVLRVEARTPNDNEGTYRISFSGGFEAMAAPTGQPETEEVAAGQTPSTARRDKNTRRVSSVGARIDEPEPVEIAKTDQPEASTGKPASEAATKTAENTETTATPAPVTTARSQRPPSARGNRRRRGRTTPPAPPETSAQNSTTATENTVEPPPPTLAARPLGIETGAKLIIETRDGVRVERFMNTVRRVTVENGQIVVTTRDGKVTRHPMTDVTRMAIEP